MINFRQALDFQEMSDIIKMKSNPRREGESMVRLQYKVFAYWGDDVSLRFVEPLVL